MELTQAEIDLLMAPKPTGLTPEEIAQLSGGAGQQPAGGSAVNQQALAELRPAVNAMGRGFRNGVTFGFADEMEAKNMGLLLGGVRDDQGEMSLFNYGTPMLERMGSILDYERGANAQAKQSHPGPFMVGDITGSVIPSVATGGAALAGQGALRAAATMTGIGALEGAVMGAGNADGENLAEKTVTGGLIGAGTGLAAVPVAGAIRGAGNRISQGLRNGVQGASPAVANRAIAQTISRSQMSPGDLHRSLLAAQSDGQGMFTLADALGNPGQRQLSGIARQPGDARTEIVEFLEGRQTGQRERVSQNLVQALDAPDTAVQRRAALDAQRQADADVNYPAARGNAEPVDVRGALSVIDERLAPMAGSNVTGDGIDSVFSRYRDRLAASPAPNGEISRELSDFDRVLGVKQSLGDDIGEAVRKGRNNEARMLTALQRELDAALEASSDGYRLANDTFRAQSRNIDAIDQGSAATSPRVRGSDTVDQFAAMTPEQQAAFRAGYADPRLARIENMAPGVNAARDLQTPKVSAELGVMANDPALLQRQIGRENTMFETRRQAIGGSQTADNLADQADVNQVSPEVLNMMASGNVPGLVSRTVAGAVNAAQGQNDATRQLIARALLSSDPEKAIADALKAGTKTNNQTALLQAILRRSTSNPLIQNQNP